MALHHQPLWLDVKLKASTLAKTLNMPVAVNVMALGLYVAIRHRRDPVNTNRKRPYLTVRLRRYKNQMPAIGLATEEVFRSEEALKDFPSDHLITQLMLVK